MGILGTVLTILGSIGMLVFGIQILILAFRSSVGWGLGTLLLFVPVGIVYVIREWRDCRTPFLRWVASFAAVAIGGAVGFFAALAGS
ncbi:MAG: hypothetical protein GX178_06165 [Acidobacteria bacterium]|nr:hypothetical protein [Thermoanaerobaculia bacterium]MDI9630674.1 hypothetical protein [Acidobacteriota bacterium]MBP7813545.1 hypothetical protein [Thermoanaerobaculia bacterium]MBP8844497.1 hypothetical protein [Thermoanaerobaculia bacterium]NLN11175.1 hypothetical protein [Acidobacteriota bacterium]